MPYTTYGLLKAIRSHQVDRSTVSASLETGRPNACNQCHLDKTLAWTGQYLEQWAQPELSQEQQTVAATILWTLRGDAGQRALMAWSMGWEEAKAASKSGWMAPYLAQLLTDPYDAVRFIAFRSIRRLPHYERFEFNFLAPPKVLVEGRRRAYKIWMAGSDHPTGESILIDPRGKLRIDTFLNLARQRDNRHMVLNE